MYNFRFVYSDSTTTTTTCDDKESAWLEGTKTSVMASMNGSRNTSSVLNDVGIIFSHTNSSPLSIYGERFSLPSTTHMHIAPDRKKGTVLFVINVHAGCSCC